MTHAKAAKALATAAAAVAATAGMAASPAGAATHPAHPTTRLHGFVPRPGSAGSARPAGVAPDFGGCATNPSASVGDLCASINSASTLADACTPSWATGVWMHYEIISPHGHVTNSRSWYRAHGNCFPVFAGPRPTVTGTWTFRTWENLGGGHYYNAEQVKLTN